MTIVRLLIRKPESLSEEEKNKIRGYYKENGFEKVYQVAKENKILPFVAHVLMWLNIETDRWSKLHEEYEIRNKSIIDSINSVFLKLKQSGVKSICALENFAVMLITHECRACFCSGDVDVTADIEERVVIEKVLKECGYEHVVRRNNMDNIMSNYFNKDVTEKGFYINLMWIPIARLYFFNQKKISERLAKERRKSKEIDGMYVKTLQPTELMYYCIIHAASSHFYTLTPGIRLYTDIDRLQKNCIIQWEKISEWAQEDNLGIRTDVLLSIYSDIMNTSLPECAYTPAKDSKTMKKLMFFLYNAEQHEFKKHRMRMQKIYAEFLSDNKPFMISALDRLFYYKREGSK